MARIQLPLQVVSIDRLAQQGWGLTAREDLGSGGTVGGDALW